MVRRVPVDEILKTSMNPRQVMDRERIAALVNSVSQIGVAQPLVLWLNRASGRYEVLDGWRRLEAARMAGLREVPAIVYEVEAEEAMKVAFSIHLSQESLSPEELVNYISLMVEREVFRSVEDACTYFGISRSWYYELERASQTRSGDLPVSVRSIIMSSGLTDEEKEMLLKEARTKRLSTRELRSIIELSESMGLESAVRAVEASRPRLVFTDPLTGEEVYECSGQERYGLRIVSGSVFLEGGESGSLRFPRRDIGVVASLLRAAESGKVRRG